MSTLLFVRFAIAIVLDAVAFIVWDVGTRPPLTLIRDIARGIRRPAAIASGIARLLAGAVLLFAAATFARPGMPTIRVFMLLETGMLIAALLIENLVGPDVRRAVRGMLRRAQT